MASPTTSSVDADLPRTTSNRQGLSRVFRRRSPTPRYGARDSSTGSLDRVYRTHDEAHEEPVYLPKRKVAEEADVASNSFGITEDRDGFFDAVFSQPEEVDIDELMRRADFTLPISFQKKDPLSLTNFLPKQWRGIRGVVRRVITTRAGIKLLKSSSASFIAYLLCLIPSFQQWLGRYSYIIVISAIINHPGRTVGAQLDGAVLTIVGTASGLGWGAFGLWLSTSSAAAQVGYGAILAVFMCLYMFVMAFLRAYYIRTYQAVICAGIAIIYTCLAEVYRSQVSWSKLLAYGLPWVLGQALSLVVCCLVVPDAGARPLAVALHDAFSIMLDGLVVPRPPGRRTHRRLAQTFVMISQAHRDLVIDISITLFDPADVRDLRNHLQSVLRALLSLKTRTRLFDDFEPAECDSHPGDFVVQVDKEAQSSTATQQKTEREILKFVASSISEPTERLLQAMRAALRSCDASLMDMSGHRRYLGPPSQVSSDVAGSRVRLRRRIMDFNAAQDSLLESNKLPPVYAEYPEVVKLFSFCRPVHQAARAIDALLVKVNNMQQTKPRYPRLHFPSYPIQKSLHRTNAQVRHDRGGVTAGSYFRSFNDISRSIQHIKARDFQPETKKMEVVEDDDMPDPSSTASRLDDESSTRKLRVGHEIWKVLRRLQGFEARFGLKTALVTSLLAIPAWLYPSIIWWDDYEAWWGVVMAWLILAPRVGGNVQDLATRVLCVVIGSVWGGLAYAAGRGEPFVMAAFAVLYLPPMVYRYTQSTHPRSGLAGCLSFVVVSLGAHNSGGQPSPAIRASITGAAMIVGVVASVVVNWILWPFVARHDLRKGISAMLFYCSIIYRNVVARYVYFEQGHDPTPEDIVASEILEGRLREGFVRLRQLLTLTRHEIRLRSPYNPLPYSALIDACERFYEYVVTVRQSSLFYHPHFIRDNQEAAARLLRHRRDAVAAVLTDLYVLSGALRSGRPVPKYLPNAAAARERLMDEMKKLEVELEAGGKLAAKDQTEGKKWAQIYHYSYNESLTGCVEMVEELEKYTKVVVGEMRLDVGLADGD